jgi:hypothetical protein
MAETVTATKQDSHVEWLAATLTAILRRTVSIVSSRQRRHRAEGVAGGVQRGVLRGQADPAALDGRNQRSRPRSTAMGAAGGIHRIGRR